MLHLFTLYVMWNTCFNDVKISFFFYVALVELYEAVILCLSKTSDGLIKS